MTGVRVKPNGDKLRLRAPHKPPDELLDLLRQHKAEILEHLHCGIGVARPPERHRLCLRCGSGLQPDDAGRSLCFTCRWSREHLWPQGPQ